MAWNKLAELCSQLLKKGVKVFVSGRLQNRSWEGQDGQQRNMTEIVIEDMLVLTAKGGEGDYVPSAAAEMAEEPVPARQMDEMPKAPKEDSKPKADKPAKEEVEDLDDLPF